jgi:hypothetical protein
MIMFKNPNQAFNNQKDTMTDILHPKQDLPPCFAVKGTHVKFSAVAKKAERQTREERNALATRY